MEGKHRTQKTNLHCVACEGRIGSK
jgi:hypothetical protein